MSKWNKTARSDQENKTHHRKDNNLQCTQALNSTGVLASQGSHHYRSSALHLRLQTITYLIWHWHERYSPPLLTAVKSQQEIFINKIFSYLLQRFCKDQNPFWTEILAPLKITGKAATDFKKSMVMPYWTRFHDPVHNSQWQLLGIKSTRQNINSSLCSGK